MDQNPSYNRLADIAIIAVFVLTLMTPLILWVGQNDVFYSEAEKRNLSHFPVMAEQQSITDFTRQFDSYFQDHFGLREWLIHRYQREAHKRFGVSGVPDVVEGTEGWLYLSGGDILDDLRGRLQFTENEKAAFWSQLLEKEAWLKEQGISYIFLIAPNKQSIYPEYLPEYFQGSGKASRLGQLLAGQPQQGGESLLDVRPNLLREKVRTRLYDKSDTHWNAEGAYLAYQAILDRSQRLFPDLKRPEDISFAPLWGKSAGGDLAGMIGKRDSTVEEIPIVENENFTAVPEEIAKSLTNLLPLPQLKLLQTTNTKRPLRVLVLHDSFFERLKPFVSEGYGSVFYVWRYYDAATMEFFTRERLQALLDIYKPDLLIEEIVERNLPHLLPEDQLQK